MDWLKLSASWRGAGVDPAVLWEWRGWASPVLTCTGPAGRVTRRFLAWCSGSGHGCVHSAQEKIGPKWWKAAAMRKKFADWRIASAVEMPNNRGDLSKLYLREKRARGSID